MSFPSPGARRALLIIAALVGSLPALHAEEPSRPCQKFDDCPSTKYVCQNGSCLFMGKRCSKNGDCPQGVVCEKEAGGAIGACVAPLNFKPIDANCAELSRRFTECEGRPPGYEKGTKKGDAWFKDIIKAQSAVCSSALRQKDLNLKPLLTTAIACVKRVKECKALMTECEKAVHDFGGELYKYPVRTPESVVPKRAK